MSRRVLLLNSPEGTGIDVSLGALPFEENVKEPASLFRFRRYRTAHLLRRRFNRDEAVRYPPLDIRDVEGIAIRNRGNLDWRYVEEQLLPLAELKDQPEILRELTRIREL